MKSTSLEVSSSCQAFLLKVRSAAVKSLDHVLESWILYQGQDQRLFGSFGFFLGIGGEG